MPTLSASRKRRKPTTKKVLVVNESSSEFSDDDEFVLPKKTVPAQSKKTQKNSNTVATRQEPSTRRIAAVSTGRNENCKIAPASSTAKPSETVKSKRSFPPSVSKRSTQICDKTKSQNRSPPKNDYVIQPPLTRKRVSVRNAATTSPPAKKAKQSAETNNPTLSTATSATVDLTSNPQATFVLFEQFLSFVKNQTSDTAADPNKLNGGGRSKKK